MAKHYVERRDGQVQSYNFKDEARFRRLYEPAVPHSPITPLERTNIRTPEPEIIRIPVSEKQPVKNSEVFEISLISDEYDIYFKENS